MMISFYVISNDIVWAKQLTRPAAKNNNGPHHPPATQTIKRANPYIRPPSIYIRIYTRLAESASRSLNVDR